MHPSCAQGGGGSVGWLYVERGRVAVNWVGQLEILMPSCFEQECVHVGWLVITMCCVLLCDIHPSFVPPGATKPMRDVKELVKDMNIQFDNLCQVGGESNHSCVDSHMQAEHACLCFFTL